MKKKGFDQEKFYALEVLVNGDIYG